MGLDVYTGTSWVDAEDVHVSNGSAFVQAKKVKVSNGTGWVLAWVPKVPTVTLSFPKQGVNANEAYNVTATLSIPAPEGTVVTFAFTGYSLAIPAVEGATTVVLNGAAHGAAGTYTWTATAVNLGGTTASAAKSQTVAVPAPTHFHEIVPNGSSAAQIQAAMNRARDWWLANKSGAVNFADEQSFACVELVQNGVYNLMDTELFPRRGVRLFSGGSGGSRAYVAAKGTHFMKNDNNGGGSYNSPNYDWLVDNLEIDCFNLAGGFSIAHVKRYQISNCYFHNMGPKKHYIEANSSGGPRADGTFNVIIKGCEFVNNQNISGRRVEDECVQLDYSWPGAASAVSGDGTHTNNVLIENCNFHDAPRAIGAHHFEAGDNPDGWHANILIRNNTFTNIDPSQYNGGDAPNGSGSEGAVRAYAWENVQILNNVFDNCFQPICLYIPGDAPTKYGNPIYFRIAGNYIRDVTQNRYGIYGTSGHASLDFEQVLIEGDIADQTWDTSPDIYFAGCDDTRGALSGSSYGCIIRNNQFRPTNISVANQKAYNKYRGANATNITGVLIDGNTVGDGTEDNS